MKGIFYGRVTHKTAVVRSIFFFSYVCFASWSPFFNIFLKNQGFTYSQVGQIAAVMTFCAVMFTLMWGFLADKIGRKRVLIFIMIVSSILFSGFLYDGGFRYFLVFTFVFAVFFTPIGSLVDSFGVSLVHDDDKVSFGGFRVWASIGWALAAVIVGFFIENRDIRLIFIIAAIVLFVTWIIGIIGLVEIKTDKSTSDISLKNMGKLLSNKKLITFLIIIFFYAVTSIPIFNMYNLYLEDLGASNRVIGIAFFLQSFCELPLFIYGDRIVKRFGVKKVFIFVIFVTCIRLFIYSQSNTVIIPLVLSVLHGVSFALFVLSSVEYVKQLVPAKWAATGQSLIWTFYMGAGMTVGSLWLGFLSDIFCMKQAVFIESILSASLLITTFIIFKFFNKPNQQSKH